MADVSQLRARAGSVVWYHTLDLGQGVVTDGFCKSYLAEDQLPPFQGRTVLDIGAWDGYYSFLAERRGAAKVVAMDHYAWGVDFARRNPYWQECHDRGVLPDHSLDTTEFWNPELPGRRGFDIAHEAYASRVEPVVADFSEVDPDRVGTFDVVLFLGVLYHLKEPLRALEAVRRLTGGVAVIETEALLVPGRQGWPVLEFTAGCYRGIDYSNWFTPSIEAIHDLCRAAGFSRTTTVVGPPAGPAPPGGSAPPTPGSTPGGGGFAAVMSGMQAAYRAGGMARIGRAVGRRVGYVLHPPAPGAAPTAAADPVHYRALVHAFV